MLVTRQANKITGPNAGGLAQFRIRTDPTARVGHFRRWVANAMRLTSVQNVRRAAGIVIAFAWCFIPTVFVGCGAKQALRKEALVDKFDKLYDAYMAGDLQQARHSLQEAVQVCEQSVPSRQGQANTLFWTYCRLYVLDKRSGDEASAESDFIKARYWGLRRYELSGNDTNGAASAVQSLTGERFIGFVDKWDKDHSDGRGPRYVQFIQKK